MSEPSPDTPLGNRRRFTFQGNLRDTRHGWLRLTPAYSVHLVRERLAELGRDHMPVLDPFSGTGTTLLACAEQGLPGDAVDLNPFLVWLARAKLARYPAPAREKARKLVARMVRSALGRSPAQPWLPPLHRIDRWWEPETLAALGRAFAALGESDAPPRIVDLARVSFCRALIDCANVSFGHQSMSFKQSDGTAGGKKRVALALERALESVLPAAAEPLGRGPRRVVLGDSRRLDKALPRRRYGAVITSPPYPNRMSYIRELRPYMYWLGYLEDRKSAGELDWQAIGGTWGAATSRLSTWKPTRPRQELPELERIAAEIAEQSPLLAAYVRKYFFDMAGHVERLVPRLARGGTLAYVVGNSKFYDTLLPVEQLFATLFERARLVNVDIEVLRKRTSKRELFEYCVTARRP